MKIRLWCAWAVISLFACTMPSVGDQAKILGNKAFSKAAWSVANQEQRGEMVASFLSQYEPTALSAESVRQLLGSPTGYYDYDENPAYFVGPQSIQTQYGKGYLLVFMTDKATGKVASVKLIPEPKP